MLMAGQPEGGVAATEGASGKAAAASRKWGVPELLALERAAVAAATPMRVRRVWLRSDGTFPNNERAPLLLFAGAFRDPRCPATGIDDGAELLVSNGWTHPWAWGVFTYHHYHSTAWEALLCVKGSADIQFGGPSGPILGAAFGDMILIPPGVAHKQLDSRDGFTLLGSYPVETPSADTCRGRPTAEQAFNIKQCPLPLRDPVFGEAQMPWGKHFSLLFEAEASAAEQVSCAI